MPVKYSHSYNGRACDLQRKLFRNILFCTCLYLKVHEWVARPLLRFSAAHSYKWKMAPSRQLSHACFQSLGLLKEPWRGSCRCGTSWSYSLSQLECHYERSVHNDVYSLWTRLVMKLQLCLFRWGCVIFERMKRKMKYINIFCSGVSTVLCSVFAAMKRVVQVFP